MSKFQIHTERSTDLNKLNMVMAMVLVSSKFALLSHAATSKNDETRFKSGQK